MYMYSGDIDNFLDNYAPQTKIMDYFGCDAGDIMTGLKSIFTLEDEEIEKIKSVLPGIIEMANQSYKVVEDNGGGLYLYVFQHNKCVYSHSGYEYNRGQLTEDLDSLDFGSDVDNWDGCDDTPQSNWDYWFTIESFGWKIVAEGKAGKRVLYPEIMGSTASLELL